MAVRQLEYMRFAFTDLSRDEGDSLIFSWKNMVLTIWREIFTLIRANLCFLLFCAPIVTIPAAVTALYGVCVDAIQGKQCAVFKNFLKTVRFQFFQSWGAFALLGVLEFIAAFGAWFYFSRGNLIAGALGLGMTAVAVVTLLAFPYCFCMLARVNLSLIQVLKNSFLMVFLNLKFSICGGVLAFALLTVLILFWLYMIPAILLCALALTAYLSCYFALYGLQNYVLTEQL